MMIKCEGPSSVLLCQKYAANEIAVLNPICSLWVIESCFELYVFQIGTGWMYGWNSSAVSCVLSLVTIKTGKVII